MKAGLYIGRFQPFHNGHLSATRYAEKKVDRLIIGIAIHRKDFDNPFSVLQRKNMLKKSGIRHKIAIVKDTKKDEDWASMIMNKFKPDIIFSNNPWTEECFKGKTKVEKIPIKIRINATKIRKLWRAGKSWRNLVPKGTARVMDNVQNKADS